MTYASMGAALGQVYDRREGNPGRYPTCATALEKSIAKQKCQPTTLRGLGATGPFPGQRSTWRFDGANPCWVETLPSCPSCLSKADFNLVAGCIASPNRAQCHWNKIAHLISLTLCSGVAPPTAVPGCLSPAQRSVADYCKAHRYGGTDRQRNALCWAAIAAKQLPAWQRAKDCPKCLTAQLALSFAAQIASGRTPSDPRAQWPLCPGEPQPKAPPCLPLGSKAANPPGYDLVQYCKRAGGTDATKNAACYLFMRSPAYWAAIGRLGKCAAACVQQTKCWDGTQICIIEQAPGGPRRDTGRRCPALPPPKCIQKLKCWDGTEICLTTQVATRPAQSTGQSCPAKPTVAPPVRRAPPPPPARRPPPPPPPVRVEPEPMPEPVQAGISTGSILLLLAAAGGGFYLWRRGKAKA